MTMSTKRKAPGKLAPPTVKSSARIPTKSAIDESRTSVAATEVLPATQIDVIDISSDADSDEDLSDDEEDADQPMVNGDSNVSSHVNGNQTGQTPSPNQEQQDEAGDSDGEAGAPSFGELLRTHDAIDVPALLQQSSTNGAVSQPTRSTIVPPPHKSLTTVLSQALRTDDTDLLESCLHTTDSVTIKNTIENIDSTLAGTLLTKLASRLYRRPGRAGSLMTWVQWTLIAHGGALASQPKVIHSLSGLQKVLSERAKGLNSLLALKGKLDLLDGQMKIRRRMQSTALIRQGDDDEEEEDVVWVEGEDEVDENNMDEVASRRKRLVEDDDGEPVMNGVMGDSSDEEDFSEEEEEDSDDGEESLDEDEVDHDDVDESMGEEEDSDVEAVPPSKVQKVAKSFSKRK